MKTFIVVMHKRGDVYERHFQFFNTVEAAKEYRKLYDEDYDNIEILECQTPGFYSVRS